MAPAARETIAVAATMSVGRCVELMVRSVYTSAFTRKLTEELKLLLRPSVLGCYKSDMRLNHFLRICCVFSLVFALRADDIQALVEKLYPKSTRLKEIRMPDMVKQLGVHEGSRVADAGCGHGQFSVILANVVGPGGHVYCEDISDNKQFGLPSAKKALKDKHVKNADLIHGTAEDPKLPQGLDAVLSVNAYHEMTKYQDMLRHIKESLRPGGRLVIMDNTPLRTAKRPRDKQTQNHVLSADLAAGELEAAGFHIVHRDDAFIDNPDQESAHWLVAAEKP